MHIAYVSSIDELLSVNEGTTKNGQYLDEFLGKTYETEFLAPFSRFLSTAFGKSYYHS